MNSLLASTVGFLNGFLALIFIIGGTAIGHYLNDQLVNYGVQVSNYGGIFGFVIGVMIAIIICGWLAIFISMRNELIEIRRLLSSATSTAYIGSDTEEA